MAPDLFSNLSPLALPETISEQIPSVPTASLVPQQTEAIARIPEFLPEILGDPTPETEEEAPAWVAQMRKDPKGLLKKLKPHTPNWNPTVLAKDFEIMYSENANGVALKVIQSRLRRPDAAADAKPFPLKVGLFYLIVCGLISLMVVVALLLAR